jgi:hypothetical protein
MPDEIDYFRQLAKNGSIAGFKCYRIIRRNRDPLATNNQAHKTEQFIDSLQVDQDIMNESTLDELYGKIDQITSDLGNLGH